ncbi:MAG: hypothetical protein LC797_12930 [Chloroflexi bacterium]|nr:hypothetical protein [Chloroflexota bacterium]
MVVEEPVMTRQRILLLEGDGPTAALLCDLFGDEGLDVTVCGSLGELRTRVVQYSRAAVVSDSWATGEYEMLSAQHRAEIVALARAAEVILTTARPWAKHIQASELGIVAIIEKPYDLNRLMTAVRDALARADISATAAQGR